MSTESTALNTTATAAHIFGRQQLLHTIPRDPEAERLALRFLDRRAPDLVGMIMGGVL